MLKNVLIFLEFVLPGEVYLLIVSDRIMCRLSSRLTAFTTRDDLLHIVICTYTNSDIHYMMQIYTTTQL